MPGACFLCPVGLSARSPLFHSGEARAALAQATIFRAGDVILAFLPFKEQRSGETPDRPTTLGIRTILKYPSYAGIVAPAKEPTWAFTNGK